ncbi:MAG: DNA-protecting protein DprA [Elusimicrobia bacterium]|nr:DNA-protecting protein DprA [Elusimicrobiota bacterium]
MKEKLEDYLLLSLVPAVGPVRFKNLLAQFGAAESVFESSSHALERVEGITPLVAQSILSYKNRIDLVKRELEEAHKVGISILTLEDDSYPLFLKRIYDPPPVLYVKGRIACLQEFSIALVGTRRPTPYGERVAAELSRDLAERGIATVSGLALGIDTVVHQSTVRSGGATIAVLGSGHLQLYPEINRKLSVAITEKGALLSEFPLRSSPEPSHFPRRNRIISALSSGTVVIEGDEKSGALITARFAAEQGKDLFAVPGPIYSKMSRGPHSLLKQGAKLVEKVEDILEEFPGLGKDLFSKSVPIPSQVTQQPFSPDLTPLEKRVSDLISFDPIAIDHLSSRSALNVGDLSQALLSLEMRGLIHSLPGRNYVRR